MDDPPLRGRRTVMSAWEGPMGIFQVREETRHCQSIYTVAKASLIWTNQHWSELIDTCIDLPDPKNDSHAITVSGVDNCSNKKMAIEPVSTVQIAA